MNSISLYASFIQQTKNRSSHLLLHCILVSHVAPNIVIWKDNLVLIVKPEIV